MAANPKVLFREATYDDILAAPEHMIAEIVDGQLVLSPRPAAPHAQAGSFAGAVLTVSFSRKPGGAGDPPGGWWILDEPELHLGRHVLVPDLAGWRRERLPVLRNVPYFTLPPDWVCEVVSPASARRDRVRKLSIYGEFGVRHAWLIDPLQRVLEVYRLEDGRWVRAAAHADDAKARVEPFEAVELELADWWLPEEPPAEEPPAEPDTAEAPPEG